MADDDAVTLEAAGHRVTISHPDKVIFPQLGGTKRDLVDYYVAVAEPLLRVAADRPSILHRFPEGAGGKSFFQKRIPANAPEWLQSTIVSTPNGTTSNALVVADIAHVLWAVNLGCIGLDLWPYRASDPEHADELRIDFDPSPGVGFEDVRAATMHCRDLLDELGIVSHPKTSGNRGIHVYVRLAPQWDSIEVRNGALALARELERRVPDLITAQWWKEERGARVFVDFNQNAPHKTVFGAWFARPRPGGQVSTPLSWDEVDDVDPDTLTIHTVPERMKATDDPWADMAAAPQSLDPLLELAATDRARGLRDAPWPPQYPKMPDE
ncbi:MAG TPA: non-homologous end-joining DNA ligase, partial [Acidimicrobiales bacterium]|nr:non-homologous end-joining DNA ligase [Acidimicrobiales bacterium]